MRLLGLDPGLQHTGWGVIEADGSRLSLRRGRHRQFDADASRWPSAWCEIHDGLREVIDEYRAGGGRGRGDLRQQEPDLDPEAGPGARRGAADAGLVRSQGRGVSGEPDQEIGGRRRPCGQGTGADDGARAAARLESPERRMPPMRSRSRSATRIIAPRSQKLGRQGFPRGAAVIGKLTGTLDCDCGRRGPDRRQRRRLCRACRQPHAVDASARTARRSAC